MKRHIGFIVCGILSIGSCFYGEVNQPQAREAQSTKEKEPPAYAQIFRAIQMLGQGFDAIHQNYIFVDQNEKFKLDKAQVCVQMIHQILEIDQKAAKKILTPADKAKLEQMRDQLNAWIERRNAVAIGEFISTKGEEFFKNIQSILETCLKLSQEEMKKNAEKEQAKKATEAHGSQVPTASTQQR